MIIARVIGSAVSTIKSDNLRGLKLLVVSRTTPSGESIGEPFVAVDSIGAGTDELVLISQGSAARRTETTDGRAVDALIMAILDSIEVGGHRTFEKS